MKNLKPSHILAYTLWLAFIALMFLSAFDIGNAVKMGGSAILMLILAVGVSISVEGK